MCCCPYLGSVSLMVYPFSMPQVHSVYSEKLFHSHFSNVPITDEFKVEGLPNRDGFMYNKPHGIFGARTMLCGMLQWGSFQLSHGSGLNHCYCRYPRFSDLMDLFLSLGSRSRTGKFGFKDRQVWCYKQWAFTTCLIMTWRWSYDPVNLRLSPKHWNGLALSHLPSFPHQESQCPHPVAVLWHLWIFLHISSVKVYAMLYMSRTWLSYHTKSSHGRKVWVPGCQTQCIPHPWLIWEVLKVQQWRSLLSPTCSDQCWSVLAFLSPQPNWLESGSAMAQSDLFNADQSAQYWSVYSVLNHWNECMRWVTLSDAEQNWASHQ